MFLSEPLVPLPKVLGIKKLPSGALFLKMDSEDSAEVMQQTTIDTNFIGNFSDSSTVNPNNYPIIVEFVPTAFNPTSQDNITEIEVANSLQPGAITTARWIKPPEKCTKNQATAHLVLHIKTRLAINSLIRLGILIASTWEMACKSLQEAKQCLKCQKLGTSHMAVQCNQIYDTWGTCASNDH